MCFEFLFYKKEEEQQIRIDPNKDTCSVCKKVFYKEAIYYTKNNTAYCLNCFK